MPRSPDWVSLVDAAYRLDTASSVWVRSLLAAARPLLDDGFGVWGFRFDLRAYVHGEPAFADLASDGLPVEMARSFQRTIAVTGRDPSLLERALLRSPIAVMSDAFGKQPAILETALSEINAEVPGVRDAIGLAARDVDGSGVFLGAHCRGTVRLTGGRRAALERVAAHITAAYRLRRSVPALATTSLADRAEAILGPGGAVKHAAGLAARNDRLAALREAAIAVDRATRVLRLQDPERALESWEALVRGRWSLLASFDAGGRRIFLAQPNEPSVTSSGWPLSAREHQVGGLLLLGHAPKLIAYELGLSVGTIYALLARMRAKLGARSTSHLLAKLRARLEQTTGRA